MIITEKGNLDVVSTNSPEDLIDFFKTYADEKWLLATIANVLEAEDISKKKVWTMTTEQLIKELGKTLASGLDDLIDYYFEDFDNFDTWEEDDWVEEAKRRYSESEKEYERQYQLRYANGRVICG